MTNDRIRFGEPIELALPPEKLPARELLVPQRIITVRKAPFQVYIVKDAYHKAWQHVRGSPHIECGGILVGHPFQTPDRKITFIVIVDVIFQDSNDRGVGHFTVSPTEIAESRIEIEQKGYLSVGWYHSHPGHGVFLSGQDMTIVRSIYNSDWHIAWVIDPLRKEEAFFQGAEGKKLSGYYKLKKEPKFVKASAFYTRANEERKAGSERLKYAKKRFKELKLILDTDSGLAHWRETGRYQEVEDILLELLTREEQVLPKKKSNSLLNTPTISNGRSDQGYDLMQIPERYDQAKVFLREALREQPPQLNAISNAWQTLTWIKEKSPGYKEVDQLTYYSGKIRQTLGSPYRRLSLEESRELEELSRLLDRLL